MKKFLSVLLRHFQYLTMIPLINFMKFWAVKINKKMVFEKDGITILIECDCDSEKKMDLGGILREFGEIFESDELELERSIIRRNIKYFFVATSSGWKKWHFQIMKIHILKQEYVSSGASLFFYMLYLALWAEKNTDAKVILMESFKKNQKLNNLDYLKKWLDDKNPFPEKATAATAHKPEAPEVENDGGE